MNTHPTSKPMAAFAAALLLLFPTAYAADKAPPDITLRATIIALPNAEAAQFISSHDLTTKPADALTALEQLVVEKKAVSVGNPSTTVANGTRALAEAKDTRLEVEPVLSESQDAVNVSIVLNHDAHKIVSNVNVKNRETKFLGSVQNSRNKDQTDFFFVVVSY